MNDRPETAGAEGREPRLPCFWAFPVHWLLVVAVFALAWWRHSFGAGLALGIVVFLVGSSYVVSRVRRKIFDAIEALVKNGRVEEARVLARAARKRMPSDPVIRAIAARLEEDSRASPLEPARPQPETTPMTRGEQADGKPCWREQDRELVAPEPSSDEESPKEMRPPPVVGDGAHGAPVIEPRVASTLAVWVWILAVPSACPFVGLVFAVPLAVCSIVLLVRRARLAWDRRIGAGGLGVSLLSFSVVAASIALIVTSGAEFANGLEAPVLAEPSWTIRIIQIGVLIASVILHECAHGVAAYWSGDGTAARAGRIRLNPLVHIDLFGSVILPVILVVSSAGFVFGWAKPVPIMPRQFRQRRRGLLGVTLAGVSINLALAFACACGLVLLGSFLVLASPDVTSEGLRVPLEEVELTGIPYPAAWELLAEALKYGILINLVLFFLNVLPIPPLDGYGVLESLAPRRLSPALTAFRPMGSLVFIGLIVLGALDYLLLPAIYAGLFLTCFAQLFTGLS